MSPPDFFAVIDVKNPFMEKNVGRIDGEEAAQEWSALRAGFEAAGMRVEVLDPVPGCEDMVFTANPAICGRNARGERICVLSRMRYPSRQREVGAHAAWYASHGYRVVELDSTIARFEGGGDAVWHPGRALLWMGAGPRTDARAHAAIAEAFDARVVTLELATERFYHLDTCFCAIDERTALMYAPAFSASSIEALRDGFSDLIEVSEREATEFFACNATACFGRTVLIQEGADETAAALTSRGFVVVPVHTREFMKSGGSVYCMKAYLEA
jgi:N-dimethylarginine dimethylaminohydrolase